MSSLTRIYPTYPILIATPQGSPIRLGTRKLYVDVPYGVYYLYIMRYLKAINELDRESVETFKKELDSDLRKVGKDYDKIYRITVVKSRTVKPYIKLSINWRLFIEYLDAKAEGYVRRAKLAKKPSEVVVEFYRNELLGNLSNILAMTKRGLEPSAIDFRMSPHEGVRFRRLIYRIGEAQAIERLIQDLYYRIGRIVKDSLETTGSVTWGRDDITLMELQFYLISFLDGIRASVLERLNVTEAFLYIRRFIEFLVRVLCYIKANSDRGPLCKGFDEDPIGKILRNNLRNYIEKLGLSTDVYKVYNFASGVIHQASRVPFYSLLEVILFRKVLSWLLESLGGTVHELDRKRFWKRMKLDDCAIRYASSLCRYYVKLKQPIMESLRNENLKSLVRLLPSWTRIERGEITVDEMLRELGEVAGKLVGMGELEIALGLYRFKELAETLAKELTGTISANTLCLGDREELVRKVAEFTTICIMQSVSSTQEG